MSYPRVDGSTSAHPLAVLIACELMDVPCVWQVDPFDATRRLVPDISQPGKEHVAEHILRSVVHQGTHGAYVNLIENRADLVLVARLPSADELVLADDLGVEMDIEPVALDAFVFLFNRHNPVSGLTVEEIRDIYTGKITDWEQVGGENAEIHAYQRDENSGSQELMKTLVMKGLQMTEPGEPMVLMGMMGPINRLSEDRDGIGYSVYFFEEFMAPNEEIKLVKVDGVLPSYESIAARKYPFTTEVYTVVRTDLDKTGGAYQLRDWLLSAEGQEVVAKSGYVPIGEES
jgi:phosphate transport system substrate-binding protein